MLSSHFCFPSDYSHAAPLTMYQVGFRARQYACASVCSLIGHCPINICLEILHRGHLSLFLPTPCHIFPICKLFRLEILRIKLPLVISGQPFRQCSLKRQNTPNQLSDYGLFVMYAMGLNSWDLFFKRYSISRMRILTAFRQLCQLRTFVCIKFSRFFCAICVLRDTKNHISRIKIFLKNCNLNMFLDKIITMQLQAFLIVISSLSINSCHFIAWMVHGGFCLNVSRSDQCCQILWLRHI